MSGSGLLLDSVILIDHFNAVESATDYLRLNRQHLRISAITRAEVLTGFDTAGVLMARGLIDALQLYPITGEIADLAARLRREHRWKLPDALQAAVALHHDCRLVTRNTRDFPLGRYAFVLTPYTFDQQ